MLRFILRRLLISIPLLFIASVLVFSVIHLTTDPVAGLRVNPRVSAADMIRYRHDLGLDRSGPQQYFAWLSNFLRGNWGNSLFSSISVSSQIREALVNSMILGITGWALALFIGVSIGVIAAIRQYSPLDHLATSGAFVALSIPTFWFALIMQLLFGVYLVRWLHLSEPVLFTAGMSLPGSVGFDPVDRLRHLALPALVLAVQLIAIYSRYGTVRTGDERRGLCHRAAVGHADDGIRDRVQPCGGYPLCRPRPKDPLCLKGPSTTRQYRLAARRW